MKIQFNGSTGLVSSSLELARVLVLEISAIIKNEVLFHTYPSLKDKRTDYSIVDDIQMQIDGTGHIFCFKRILEWQERRAIKIFKN